MSQETAPATSEQSAPNAPAQGRVCVGEGGKDKESCPHTEPPDREDLPSPLKDETGLQPDFTFPTKFFSS